MSSCQFWPVRADATPLRLESDAKRQRPQSAPPFRPDEAQAYLALTSIFFCCFTGFRFLGQPQGALVSPVEYRRHSRIGGEP